MSKVWDNLEYYLKLHPVLEVMCYTAVVLLCGAVLFWLFRLFRFLRHGVKIASALRKVPKQRLLRNRFVGIWARGTAKKTDLFFDAGDCIYAIKYFSVHPLGRKLVLTSQREWLLEKKILGPKAVQSVGYTSIPLPEYDNTKGMPLKWQGKPCKKAYLFCPPPASFCLYADRAGEVYALQEIHGFVLLTPNTLGRFLQDPGQITQSNLPKKRFFEE